ncbi:MAG: hypothetical protein JW807_13630 [Spirochaetes bacterium]|nr:hypothetical protein [Spirochaetota bacterium]
MECHGGEVRGAAPCAPVPVHALQQVEERPGVEAGLKEREGDEPEDEKKYILCRFCRNAVTSDDLRIEMDGSHEHSFMNPAGIVFRIGCFSMAGGCLIMGIPTTEYTWFPGFAWCYVVCSSCLTHLGWHYRSGATGFFGLILDRLAVQ